MTLDRDRFEKKFAVLRKRFATRLVEYADQLEDSLRRCPDSHAELTDLVHRVAGTAGSFGFAELSAAAGPLDEEFATGVEPCQRRDRLEALAVMLRTHALAATA